ncbi:MAG TPA: nucleotide pyrophosphatase/phosphodiesterase family protein [Cytophagales bacterium]|nr:nucleotide pyrophosphatase/phosphodiesterase family protein [Cytophagales bacterium]
MKKTVVINVVGLSKNLIGTSTPFLNNYIKKKRTAFIKPIIPAVTCAVQATYFTGKTPTEHGIVGNGWYFKDLCEIKFWHQSNKLVQSPKLWEMAKSMDPSFTCANMFWWFNMYSSVDFSITPRPQYHADGIKLPDVYSHPPELRDLMQKELGTFPLFDFWGPKTSIKSSKWIADASMRADEVNNPTLTLIYLPHLDYCLQKFNKEDQRIKSDLAEIDKVCEDLVKFYEGRDAQVIILSEYGINEVSNPISLNRIFRENGLLAVREESGHELLDPGASEAFAVVDHQLAHIYVNDLNKMNQVRAILEKTPGIEMILGKEEKKLHGLDHSRAGDLVVLADRKSWFNYYYWLDDAKAPDFARIVEIHKKPGFDPVEMFLNPSIKFPLVKVGSILMKKKLGFRYLMDVIPLDPSLIKGSHGRYPDSPEEGPLIIASEDSPLNKNAIDATEVCNLILDHLR